MSQESIERNQQIREDNTDVSPEAAKVQELVDQVQEMEEIRTEEACIRTGTNQTGRLQQPRNNQPDRWKASRRNLVGKSSP